MSLNMKKNLLTLCLIFISQLYLFGQYNNNNCVSRGVLAGYIYEVLYDGNDPDDYYPAANYPLAFTDVIGSSELQKKISIVNGQISYLVYPR